MNRKIPLVRGFDDVFYAPHSRHTDVPIEKIRADERLMILAESERQEHTLSWHRMEDRFCDGTSGVRRVTLDQEYKRDLSKGLPIEMPENYYPDNDSTQKPLLTWRAHGNCMYANWLNYYVYQATPYDMVDQMVFYYILF